MLKYRLIFGTLMTIVFVGLILLDGHLDGSLSAEKTNCKIQGTILAVFLLLVAIPANIEFAKLVKSAGAKVFLPITIPCSILLADGWYLAQFFPNKLQAAAMIFMLTICLGLLMIFLWQGAKFAMAGAFANIGANLLAIVYLGALSGFVMAFRIDFGPLAFLMYIFTVKCSDIGAYTLGRICGKHKFSPVISPKKTWEGMLGACVFAAIVSSIFAKTFGIMPLRQAVLFGIIFAFLGQLGDLAESMLKRASEQKDSSNTVPGFGGILDVIDSPLATGVFAYLFFAFFGGFN
jgi:phosphatidate cytidylyltransferase